MSHVSSTEPVVRVRRVGGVSPTPPPAHGPLGLDQQVEAFLHRVAQHEPQEGQHGLMVRYDSSWRALGLVDSREQDPEKRFQPLGPISEASLRLQHIFGLTPHQAEQAVGIAVQKFNTDLNIEWLKRVAQARALPDSRPLGTPDDARIWADQIDPLHRVFALELIAFAMGSKVAPPMLQEGMTQEDGTDIALVLQAFGVEVPGLQAGSTVPQVNSVAEGMVLHAAMELGSEAGADGDEAMMGIAYEVAEAAQRLASMIETGSTEFRFTLPNLNAEKRAALAKQLSGMREIIGAVEAAIHRSFGPTA